MIDKIAASIVASNTGLGHTITRRSLDAGKETPEARKAKEEQALEYTKRVQVVSPIYDAQGKIIGRRWREVPMIYNAKGEPIDPRCGEQIDIEG